MINAGHSAQGSLEMTLIRPFEETDRQQVIALWHTCTLTRPWNDPNKDIDRKNGFGADLFLVMMSDERLVGTVMGGYDGHRGVMNYLAVDPEFRGKGLGRLLVEALETKLRALGCPKINLLVRTDNIAVSDFYSTLDYKAQDDVVVFGKRLIEDD